MEKYKTKIFTIGYSDNTSTSYILNYLISRGQVPDGIILCKSNFITNWKRFINKIKHRGFSSGVKRLFENLFIRKNEIKRICRQYKNQIFFVNKFNSVQVRDILIANKVKFLILTSTPIIEPILLEIDGLTIINAHTGWLPQYRGLDANLKALRDGIQPGVSIHKVTKRIDAGEVYLREKFTIDPGIDILKQMDKKELELSAKLLRDIITLLKTNKLKPIVNPEPLGKYESSLSKHEIKNILQNISNIRIVK